MSRFRLTIFRAGILTGLYVVLWRGAVFLFDEALIDTLGWAAFYLIGLCWTVFLVERAARRIEQHHRATDEATQFQQMLGNEPAASRQTWNPLDPASRLYTSTAVVLASLVSGSLAIAAWVTLTLATRSGAREGLLNAIQGVEIAAIVLVMLSLSAAFAQSRRLRQSLGSLAAYSLFFALIYFLAHLQFGASGELEAELPAGGGSDSIKASSVKVQKIVRKKYVINPYSSIVFAAPPPIDKIEMKLLEETSNQYKAGQGPGGLGKGAGKGGGFGSGSAKGRWELVRLRHSDRSWNKNFGIGGDRNLLAEIKAREPLVKIPDEDQSVDYTTLARYSPKKPLALLYIGGVQTFAPTAAEKKILREYLIDKHGMVLGDNLGGSRFHGEFVAAMTEITGVKEVPIPRDDRIHQSPYALPQLPIVVAHGGTTALGWKVDGRWVAYYHPGALSDAWRDDHAGIKREIWEQCYQLGINILYYAYVEQDSWRESQKP